MLGQYMGEVVPTFGLALTIQILRREPLAFDRCGQGLVHDARVLVCLVYQLHQSSRVRARPVTNPSLGLRPKKRAAARACAICRRSAGAHSITRARTIRSAGERVAVREASNIADCTARLATAVPFRLHRRARHSAEAAEDAAVTRVRPEEGTALGAFVEEQARVGRHGFRFRTAAIRARKDRLQD